MSQDQDLDLELDEDYEDELTDEEIELMTTPYVDLRLFNLNNATGSSVMGIAISETDDSFLVGLPCRLLRLANGELQVGQYVPVKLTRLFKHGLISITEIFGEFLEYYTAYLKNKGLVEHPEFKKYFGEELFIEIDSPAAIMAETLEEMQVSPETEEKIVEAMAMGSIGIGNTLRH